MKRLLFFLQVLLSVLFCASAWGKVNDGLLYEEVTIEGVTYVYKINTSSAYFSPQYAQFDDIGHLATLIGIKGNVPDSLVIPDSLGHYPVDHVSLSSDYTSSSCANVVRHVEFPCYCRLIQGGFCNWSNLESVTLDANLQLLDNAFVGCGNIKRVTCLAVEPPKTVWKNYIQTAPFDSWVFVPFDSVVFANATLSVRPKCKNAYSLSAGWSSFQNLVEMEGPEFCDGELRYGTLNGFRFVYTVLSAAERTCVFGRQVEYNDESPFYYFGPNSFGGPDPHLDPWFAFNDKNANSLRGTLVIPREIDGLKVTELGTGCLYLCRYIDSIYIPETVEKIGDLVLWQDEELKSLRIPASVKYIGKRFTHNPINSLTVDPANPFYDSRDNCNALIHTATNTLLAAAQHNASIPEGVEAIEDYALKWCDIGPDLNLPTSVSKVGVGAFYGTKFVNVHLSQSLSEIDFLFSNCLRLKNVSFDDDVNTIGKALFSGCNYLNNVILPPSLERIDSAAFEYCCSLNDISFPASLSYLGDRAFFTTGLKVIEMPDCALSVGKRVFSGLAWPYRIIILPEHYDGFGERMFDRVAGDSFVFDYSEKFNLSTLRENYIFSKIENPHDIPFYTFYHDSDIKLYIPKGTKGLYENATGWNWFRYMLEYDVNVLNDVLAADASSPVSIYNTGGVKLDALNKGLNIVKLKSGKSSVVFNR